MPTGQNFSLPTQTKRRKTPATVYSLDRVGLEKHNSNKTKWPKSPIALHRTSEEDFDEDVRGKRSYVKKLLKKKCVKIKRRKHDLPSNIQEEPEIKPVSILKIGLENLNLKSTGIHGKLVRKKDHDEILEKNSDKKPDLELRLSKKIWQLMSRDMFPNLDDEKQVGKIQVTDAEMRKYIISVIKKYNKKDVKRYNAPIVTQTRKGSLKSKSYYDYGKQNDQSDKKRAIKRKVRRQIWQWTKNAIKNNEHWSQILAENHVAIDNINIDEMDLSVIDVDALGIENKLLKRTILWLLK